MIRLMYCLLLLPLASSAQLYKPYAKPVRWAATGEIGGISPLVSANLEYAPVQCRKSFVVIHGGIGQLFSGYSFCTLPHALTWNILLNGKAKGCPPVKPRNQLFAELGAGGVYLAGAKDGNAYRWSPLLGVRRYFSYNLLATGFWKAQLTPLVAGRLVPWGGVGIGLVID
ncbi:MAG: hypothetical protein H7Z72_14600 [Bacteroidetes bacterium]|nr:hypothetical protein [Fibrella sp.]